MTLVGFILALLFCWWIGWKRWLYFNLATTAIVCMAALPNPDDGSVIIMVTLALLGWLVLELHLYKMRIRDRAIAAADHAAAVALANRPQVVHHYHHHEREAQ